MGGISKTVFIELETHIIIINYFKKSCMYATDNGQNRMIVAQTHLKTRPKEMTVS